MGQGPLQIVAGNGVLVARHALEGLKTSLLRGNDRGKRLAIGVE